MSRARRLSACVVNYGSGAFALRCVTSLQEEWRRAGRAAGDLEVVVVDNASPTDQRVWLAELAARGARVVESGANGGYATGIELARARTSGAPSDALAVLNPDLVFLPGSVARLLDALADPTVGLVAPRAWVDEDRTVQLPPHPLPSPAELLATEIARLRPELARRYARRRLRRSLAWWTASAPHDARMLSGACLFLRRDVLPAGEALLDARFPLYFEDSDLCRRLRDRGLRLVHEPRAEVLHHWSRSAGAGEEFAGEPLRRYAISRAAFLEKHHGRAARALDAWVREAVARRPAAGLDRAFHDFAELGERAEPPALAWERAAPWVLEISPAPLFLLAGGALGEGARFAFGERLWSWLFPGRWFVRVLERDAERLLGAFTFLKTSPARSAPRGPEGEAEWGRTA